MNLKKKKDPTIFCLQETHFRFKDTQAESESMEIDTIQIVIQRKQGWLYLFKINCVKNSRRIQKYQVKTPISLLLCDNDSCINHLLVHKHVNN